MSDIKFNEGRNITEFFVCTIPLYCNQLQQLEDFFMFLSLGKMWGNVEPTSLTLLDEATLCFSFLKLLTANPVDCLTVSYRILQVVLGRKKMKFSFPVDCLRAESDFASVSLENVNDSMHGDQRLFPHMGDLSEVVCWQSRYEHIFLDCWSHYHIIILFTS